MSDLSVVPQYSSAMQKIDPDHIIALVTEVIPTHSCLVFCPTKKNCENVAGMICKYLKEWVKQSSTSVSLLLTAPTDSVSVTVPGSICCTGRPRRPPCSESSGTAGTARCVLCSGRLCHMVWLITTAGWWLRRENWLRRPTPAGCSASSPVPPPWLQGSTFLPAGESFTAGGEKIIFFSCLVLVS